jgi:hypothetical protein
MSQRIFILTLAVALVGIATWAVAQQAKPVEPGGSQNALSGPALQPEPKKAEGGHGPFAVAASGETAVLLDTARGKTWVLQQAGNGGAVWVPARRLDSEKEAREWLEEKRAKGTALQDQVRAHRAALEARQRARQEEAEKERGRLFRQQQEGERLRAAREDRERARKALEDAERRLRELEQEPKSPRQ